MGSITLLPNKFWSRKKKRLNYLSSHFRHRIGGLKKELSELLYHYFPISYSILLFDLLLFHDFLNSLEPL